MKKILTAITAFITLLFSVTSYAAPIDFEDLALGSTYFSGDTFVTSGYTIEASDFQWSDGIWTSSGFASVDNGGLAGGSGQDLAVNNINLNFILGGPMDRVELLFGEYGGNLNIEINGSFLNFENFADIDGMFIGGAHIEVVNGLGNDQGALFVTGSISSFAIGGQELWIDNVEFLVPVPAAVWLFGSGIIGLIGVARRNARS